jgi:hypothetical protein
MGMSENDRVDRFCRPRQGRPVTQSQILDSLKQPAIDEDAQTGFFKQILRSVTVLIAPRQVSLMIPPWDRDEVAPGPFQRIWAPRY